MSHSLTEADEFTTSVVVPDDADTANAASVAAAIQPLANRTKNLNGRLTTAESDIDSLESGKVTGPATATDNAIVRFDGATGKLAQNSGAAVDDSGNLVTDGEYSYGTPKVRSVVFHAWETQPSAGWTRNADGMVSSEPLKPLDLFVRLPHGAVIQEIKVIIDPSSSGTTVSIYDYDLDFSTGATSETQQYLGSLAGTGLQIVTIDCSSPVYTVDRQVPISIRVVSTGVSGGDVLYGAQVTFDDPGPRN